MESSDLDEPDFTEEEENDQGLALLLPKNVPHHQALKPLYFGENVNLKMSQLYTLRQNCRNDLDYNHLEEQTTALISEAAKNGKAAIEVRFILEQAKNAQAKRDMDRTIEIAELAIQKSRNLNPNECYQFQLICNFLMTSSYCNLHKYGMAWSILERLEKLIINVDNPVDKWKLYYNTGTHYLSYLKTNPQHFAGNKVSATQAFEKSRKAIEDALQQGSDFQLLEQKYPLIMMAKVLLDVPETEMGHKRPFSDYSVTRENIKEARNILQSVKSSTAVEQMGVRFIARLIITEAGYHFRTAQFNLKLSKDHKKKDIEYLLKARENIFNALTVLEYVSLICRDTQYVEKTFAETFLSFLQTFAKEHFHSVYHEEDFTKSSSDTSSSEDGAWKQMQSFDTPQEEEIAAMQLAEESQGKRNKIPSESPFFDFVQPWVLKMAASDSIAEFYIQEQFVKDLKDIRSNMTKILELKPSYPTLKHLQLIQYSTLLMARIESDFPETEWRMNKFDVTYENLQRTKGYLTEIKHNLYLHEMCPTLQANFLLAEGSFHYRNSQMFYNMQKVESAKSDLCDGIMKIEHALICLQRDECPNIQNMILSVSNLLNHMHDLQKKLLKIT